MEARLSDPQLYARDPKAFAEAGRALEKVRAELSAAEDEWLKLAEKREMLAAGAG